MACAGVEFVPVDAGPEGRLDHVGVVVVVFARPVPAFVFLEDAVGVGVCAFHVAVPFTGASHVFRWKSAVVEEHELELGVDAALEPVAVAGDGPVFE